MNIAKSEHRSRRRSMTFRLTSVVAAIAIVAMLVLQHSQSAFSGQTQFAAPTLSAGTVSLTTNVATLTAIPVTDLIPGDVVTRCVMVKYEGNLTGSSLDTVRVYGTLDSTTGLSQYLNFTVDFGAKGATCSAFSTVGGKSDAMNNYFATYHDYASGGVTGWKPADGDTVRPFQFTMKLPSSTGNAAQNVSVKPTIAWEVRTLDSAATTTK